MIEPWYFDTSALVKLVIREAESGALREWMRAHDVLPTASDIARVEVVRAVRRIDESALPRAQTLLTSVDFARLDISTLHTASMLPPADMRSLDAIHVAAALHLAGEVRGVVSYDRLLTTAARAAGLVAIAPE